MPARQRASSGGPTPTKPKIRIVVADDHPIFRDGLCRLLALEEDFEVVAQARTAGRCSRSCSSTSPIFFCSI